MTLMVLDGNSLLNRAFYGVKAPLSTRDGLPTGAVLGFCNILFKLMDTHSPEALCVTFDLKAPTFRHLMYDGYKAHRRPMPEDLALQLPLCKELLDAMSIKRYELEGFEADDLLGTFSLVCQDGGWDCLLVTGDRDAFQLVGQGTTVLHVTSRMGHTDTIPYDEGAIRAEYGLSPSQLIDLKALMGDSSDNIPGVPGVGEKTALDLMHRFGSLDELYERYQDADLRPAVKNKLESGRESALLSRRLARIDRQAPIGFDPEDARRVAWDGQTLLAMLRKLEFRKLIEKLGLERGGDASLPDPGAGVVSPVAFTPPQILEIPNLDESATERLLATCRATSGVGVVCSHDLSSLWISTGQETFSVSAMAMGPECFDAFARVFFGPGILKIAHGVKSLMVSLLGQGLPCEDFSMDTELGAYLLAPVAGAYPLDAVIADNLGFTPGSDADRAGSLPELAVRLTEKLSALDMDKLLFQLELPLCRVLADMERTGCKVDREGLREFGRMLHDRLVACQQRIFKLTDCEFNLASPKQLSAVLFERLGLPAVKKTKTGYATDVDVLKKLQPYHPVVAEIIEFRKLSKLKSTYVDGLLKVIASDGRIRTSFQMTATATGRLSSAEPNLQNIPVRTELGGQLRRLFVPQDEHHVLVDADYSQIELRLLAHIAADANMRAAFALGEDIHTATAAQVFGVAPQEVTPEMRRRAKAVNFGIVYGISAFSLSEDIGVSVSQAKGYMDGYLSHYAGVRDYMKQVVEKAKRDGYVATLLGRRRPMPELSASNHNVRAFGERVALNAPIQGTAADIIKAAMLAVWRRLAAEGLSGRLILQVHDELIVECPREEAQLVRAILTEEMERVFPLDPPLVAEAHVGENWLEAK